MYLLSQIIGAVALIVWVSSVQSNDKKKILELQIIANIFYSIQYILIGALSAGALAIVAIIRMITFYKSEKEGKQNSVLSCIVLNLLIIVVTGIFYQNLYSLLPMVIGMIYTYATWQKNTVVIRVCFLVAGIMWIFYNIYVGAYVALIGNLFEIFSGIISIIRFDFLKQK